ncbi:hypothetical protein G6F57_022036 [Rhizopus arrhizus]|nr:hypothetical protein G6F57_022036 [Rhizopus arrhizus]
MRQPLLVAFHGGAGADFGLDEPLHGRLSHDTARHFHAADEAVAIDLRRQEVRADRRARQGIGGFDVDAAHRFRAQLRHADRHARMTVQDAFGRVGIAGMHEEELHVGRRQVRRALDEAVDESRP